jgi:hypothetical protein
MMGERQGKGMRSAGAGAVVGGLKPGKMCHLICLAHFFAIFLGRTQRTGAGGHGMLVGRGPRKP